MTTTVVSGDTSHFFTESFICKACTSQRFRAGPAHTQTHAHLNSEQGQASSSIYVPQNTRRKSRPSTSMYFYMYFYCYYWCLSLILYRYPLTILTGFTWTAKFSKRSVNLTVRRIMPLAQCHVSEKYIGGPGPRDLAYPYWSHSQRFGHNSSFAEVRLSVSSLIGKPPQKR